jgi:hypothetical protein
MKGNTMRKRERVLIKLEGDILSPEQYGRHLFDLWISGCYGQEQWDRRAKIVKENYDDDKAMRRFVITEFCLMLASECDCSSGYAQSIMATHFDKTTLDKLNVALIKDVREYFEHYINERKSA